MTMLTEGGTETREICRECRHEITEHHSALGCTHAVAGEVEKFECVCLGYVE